MPKSILGFVLAATIATPSAAFADTYWYCQFAPKDNPKLMYFSDTFGPVENTGVGPNITGRRLTAAMKTYIVGKYSVMDGFPGCAFSDSEDKAKAELKRNEDLVTKNGGKFIATDWRYTGK